MKFGAPHDVVVQLIVNDQYLPENGDDTDALQTPGTQSTYVEATSGSNFAVYIALGPKSMYVRDDIQCEVFLDGNLATSLVHQPVNGSSCTIYGARTSRAGQWSLQKFVFADLRTDDGAVKTSQLETLKQLGTVRVRLTRVRVRTTYLADHAGYFKPAVDGSVPEKGLKGRAVSNHARLGAAEYIPPVHTAQLEYPYGTLPFATATYKYRSRRDLQIERIIPRSPSPIPLEERDPEDLSPAEARELVRRMRARQDRVKIEIKKEKRDRATVIEDDVDGDNDEVTIESESRGRKRYRTFRDSGVEVVDLSED